MEKVTLRCPCGELIVAADEDELVAKAEEHLRREHPDLAGVYSREDILAFAY
jgi:predicted small metal-binding protein